MNSPLEVGYYTDVLCVWTWIAQHRIDEIEKEWAERIRIRHYILSANIEELLNNPVDEASWC